MEQTLIIFKPDAVMRDLVGEILGRFERVGLKIVGTKMLAPDYDHYYHHYETIGKMISRRGQEAFDVNLELMQGGPVIAVVLEGVGAVSQVRKMVGDTEPRAALPGTIRGDYAHVSFTHANSNRLAIANLIHASGDPEEAVKEIAHWFKPEEVFFLRRHAPTLHAAYAATTAVNLSSCLHLVECYVVKTEHSTTCPHSSMDKITPS